MKKLPFLILIISFCACSPDKQEEKTISSKITNQEIVDTCSNKYENILKNIYDNLSAYKIKENFGGTSGVVSDWTHKYYHEVDSTGFYGMYYLIQEKITPPIVPFEGELVIFTNSHPWKASDKNEKFIEIITYTAKIKLSNEIFVGRNKEDIFELLGEPQNEVNDVLFYYDNNIYMLSLKIKNDTINTLRFGYYKEDVNMTELQQSIIDYFELRSL